MKNVILALLCCAALCAEASGTDSLFRRHQISLSMSNGVSQNFFDGPGHKPTAVAQESTGNIYWYGSSIHASYVPLYAMHLQLHYSLGINSAWRIETGIGYLMSSYLVKERDIIYGDIYYENVTYNNYHFTGSITLPLYVKYTKAMGHGALTCTAGPDFTLPVHYITHEADRINTINGAHEADINQHGRLQTNATGRQSTMGLYLKLGYEKKISNGLSVNVGPAIDFFQLVQFHNTDWVSNSLGYHPYQYYAGLDVAVNFGMKK